MNSQEKGDALAEPKLGHPDKTVLENPKEEGTAVKADPRVESKVNFYSKLLANVLVDLVFDFAFLLLVVLSNFVLKPVTKFAAKFNEQILWKVVVCALIEVALDLSLSVVYVHSWRR